MAPSPHQNPQCLLSRTGHWPRFAHQNTSYVWCPRQDHWHLLFPFGDWCQGHRFLTKIPLHLLSSTRHWHLLAVWHWCPRQPWQPFPFWLLVPKGTIFPQKYIFIWCPGQSDWHLLPSKIGHQDRAIGPFSASMIGTKWYCIPSQNMSSAWCPRQGHCHLLPSRIGAKNRPIDPLFPLVIGTIWHRDLAKMPHMFRVQDRPIGTFSSLQYVSCPGQAHRHILFSAIGRYSLLTRIYLIVWFPEQGNWHLLPSAIGAKWHFFPQNTLSFGTQDNAIFTFSPPKIGPQDKVIGLFFSLMIGTKWHCLLTKNTSLVRCPRQAHWHFLPFAIGTKWQVLLTRILYGLVPETGPSPLRRFALNGTLSPTKYLICWASCTRLLVPSSLLGLVPSGTVYSPKYLILLVHTTGQLTPTHSAICNKIRSSSPPKVDWC